MLAGGAGQLVAGVALDQLAWRVTGSRRRPWRALQPLLAANTTAALLVVRNPLDRLVSAYRNKLECRAGKEYYHQVRPRLPWPP